LGHAGIELRFAAIDLTQPLAQMARKLRNVKLELLAARLERLAGDCGYKFAGGLFGDLQKAAVGR
jgi:hypothetical protein